MVATTVQSYRQTAACDHDAALVRLAMRENWRSEATVPTAHP
jgi:hypothetical protein